VAAICFSGNLMMTAPFRLYGAELSPYSVKLRSYLRYKGFDFQWLPRTDARREEFARLAKQPMVPVLVDADDVAMQDSTPIIEKLEQELPEPSIIPAEQSLAFVAALLEDYADEWLNKAMVHYRWSYPDDQESAARRTVETLFAGAEAPEGFAESVRTRMVGRLHHVGSSPETAPIIEGSFARLIVHLDKLVWSRPYLFGGRPSLADFGLAGQLKQLLSDPTPSAMIRAQAPNLARWVDRMDAPEASGDFVSFAAVRDDLAELLREEVAGAYLAWASANAQAVEDDAMGVSVEIAGRTFSQKPQRYTAKAFAELKRKRGAVDDDALSALLLETGCDAYLAPSSTIASPELEPDPEAEVGGGEDDGED
jgi:glutathione S-transferase